jgi:hypothetical protein
MKIRHAAALALVGWYLMTPPACKLFDCNKRFVNSRATIRRWEIGGTFGSSADCEIAREKLRQKARHDEEVELEAAAREDANPDDQAVAAFEAARLGKCVSKDDPRFKGK